jgi:UDP-glucose:(heptosyl)LPS alpha-1,3-glucosyltransferase
MRIALIRSRYNPYGGAERFVARAIAALAARGALITLIAREWSDGTGKQEVIRCDPPYLGKVWRDASFAHAVRKILDERQFDLVQSHERIAGCDIYRAGDGVHAEWLSQRRRVLGPPGRLGLELNPHHQYLLNAERRMFTDGRLRIVVCNSAMVRDEIRTRFGVDETKLQVIYNGVDTEIFHPRLAEQHRHVVRDRLRIPRDAKLFLLVGSGFVRKGVPALLAAMARLPQTYALIIGADRSLRRYRAETSSRVLFLGGQEDVRPYYGAADAFVLPALYDPQPNAALEALACGLPVVTSTKCGAAEIVTEGVSGFVRDALDIAGIAAAMEAAVDTGRNPGLRVAARKAAEPFTLDAMASRMFNLYETLIPRQLA